MKTPREASHDVLGDCVDPEEHSPRCDRLAAAIEARDDEWAERERVAFQGGAGDRAYGTAVPEVCGVCNGKRKVPVDFPAMPCPACSPGGEP